MICDECGVEYTVKPPDEEYDSECYTCMAKRRPPHQEKSRSDWAGKTGVVKMEYSIVDHDTYWWILPLIMFALCFCLTVYFFSGILGIMTAGLTGVGIGSFWAAISGASMYYEFFKKHRCQKCGTKWAAVKVRTWSAHKRASTLYHNEMKCRECGAEYTIEATVEDE